MKKKGFIRIILLLLAVCMTAFAVGAVSGCSSDRSDPEEEWSGFFLRAKGGEEIDLRDCRFESSYQKQVRLHG